LEEVNEGLAARMTQDELALIAGCSPQAIGRHARHSTAEIEAIRQARADEADPRAAWRRVMAIAQTQNDAPTMKACQKELDRLAGRADANKPADPKQLAPEYIKAVRAALGFREGEPERQDEDLCEMLEKFGEREQGKAEPDMVSVLLAGTLNSRLRKQALPTKLAELVERFAQELQELPEVVG